MKPLPLFFLTTLLTIVSAYPKAKSEDGNNIKLQAAEGGTSNALPQNPAGYTQQVMSSKPSHSYDTSSLVEPVKIYVTRLAEENNVELSTAFSKFGEVTDVSMIYLEDGSFSHSALVTMTSYDEAKKAIDALNDSILGESYIRVMFESDNQIGKLLFVGLSCDTRPNEVENACVRWGTVKGVRMYRNYHNGVSHCMFQVHMEYLDEARGVINGLNGTDWYGKGTIVHVMWDVQKTQTEANIAERPLWEISDEVQMDKKVVVEVLRTRKGGSVLVNF